MIALAETNFSLTGSVATICSQASVVCFHSNGSSYTGLPFIRGYSNAGTGTLDNPIVKNAFLSAGSCSPDPSFTTASCNPVLVANIDTGGAGTDLRAKPVPNVTIKAGATTLTCVAPCNANVNQWTASVASPASGLGSFTLTGTYKPCPGNTNACKTKNMTFQTAPVQRMFVGPDDPVELAEFIENGRHRQLDGGGIAHVFRADRGAALAAGGHQRRRPAGHARREPVELTPNALDCDPSIPNFKSELASGCSPQYAPNTFAAPWYPCPKPNSFSAQPWQCVALQTASSRPAN